MKRFSRVLGKATTSFTITHSISNEINFNHNLAEHTVQRMKAIVQNAFCPAININPSDSNFVCWSIVTMLFAQGIGSSPTSYIEACFSPDSQYVISGEASGNFCVKIIVSG